jgi:hypothetical protein
LIAVRISGEKQNRCTTGKTDVRLKDELGLRPVPKPTMDSHRLGVVYQFCIRGRISTSWAARVVCVYDLIDDVNSSRRSEAPKSLPRKFYSIGLECPQELTSLSSSDVKGVRSYMKADHYGSYKQDGYAGNVENIRWKM